MDKSEVSPLFYDEGVVFELLPRPERCAQVYSGNIGGMGKEYDEYTKTMTSNISNNFNLSFQKSTCTNHLQCSNEDCNFIIRNPVRLTL